MAPPLFPYPCAAAEALRSARPAAHAAGARATGAGLARGMTTPPAAATMGGSETCCLAAAAAGDDSAQSMDNVRHEVAQARR